MSKLKILVVDDTREFSESLERLFKTMGHSCDICLKPEEAHSIVASKSYDLILIDCFMPNIDGFNLSAELNENLKPHTTKTKFFLMSGILTDENSKKEALSYPHVSHFLAKPFSKEEFEEAIAMHFTEPDSVLRDLLASDFSHSEVSALLESQSIFSGLDLTILIPILSKSEATCKLKFTNQKDKSAFTVIFESGHLAKISSTEYKNSLGELLVGLKFISREELSNYINSEAFKNSTKPIGQALVERNILSPHAVPQALKQQNINRLHEILSLEMTEVEFSFSSPIKKDNNSASLNSYEITRECVHWLKNHASDSLLKELQQTLSKCEFEISSVVVSTDQDFQSLKDLIQQKTSDMGKDDFISLIAALLNEKVKMIESSETPVVVEKNSTLELLKDLQSRINESDPYIILGINPRNTSNQKISKKYQELAKSIHPDKLINTFSDSELKWAQEVFSEITKAFNLIKTEDNRKTYESFRRNKSTQIKLQCNNQLESSKVLLSSGNYKKALELLNDPKMHENYPNEFGLYFLWAALKSDNDINIKSIENELLNREKKNLVNEALYYYVKSLIALKSNNIESFQTFVQKSLQLDPQFLPARRELQVVKSKLAQKNSNKSKSWFGFKKSS